MISKKIKFLNVVLILSLVMIVLIGCKESNEFAETMEKGKQEFQEKMYKEALATFNEITKLDTANYEAWTLKGRCLFTLEKNKDAILAFNKVIEINPEYAPAYSLRGSIYMLMNEPFNAEDDIETAIALDPVNTSYLKQKAELFDSQGRIKEAVKVLDDIIQIDSTNYEAYYFRAVYKKTFNNKKNVFDDLNKSLDIINRTYDEDTIDYDKLSIKACVLYEMNDLENALICQEKYLEYNPNDHKALCLKGYILIKEKRFEEANEIFDLVSILKEQFKVATLSRGYKRKSKGFILADESSGIHDIGDEPKQIRRKFPDIQVAVLLHQTVNFCSIF